MKSSPPGEAADVTDQANDARRRALALLALYAALEADTAALYTAVEREQTDDLEARATARAARLDEAARLLAACGPRAAALPADLREDVLAALRSLQRQDEALRALLAARVQEVPAQLAALRVARRTAAGYAGRAGEPSTLLDQKR